MDIQRLIAFVVFSFSALLLWDAWQKHNVPKPPASAVPVASPATANGGPVPVPVATPVASTTPAPQAGPTPPAPSAISDARVAATGQPVIVTTDLFEVELNTVGGDIRRLKLFKVFSALDRTKPLTLLAPDPKEYFVTQSGLLGEGLEAIRRDEAIRVGVGGRRKRNG